MGIYYADTKFFHFHEQLKALEADESFAPVHIRIKPTNRCNHRCWYCGYQNDAAISLGEQLNVADAIPKDKMLEITEDLIVMGVKAVTFTGGGEPLLYPHFEAFFKGLYEGGIALAVLTNGALLKGDKAELLANRATWVRVSMDGYDDESYGSYRGVKGGEFTRIVANMRNFAGMKGSTVLGISVNLDEKNWGRIPFMVEMARDVGADHIKFSGCVVANDGNENNAYHAPFFDEANQLIHEAQKSVADTPFQVINAYHKMPGNFSKVYQTCHFARFLTVIAADLGVYTCQDKAYTESGKLGSLEHQRFRDFWFSEAMRRGPKLRPDRDCNHHCVADRKNRMLTEYLAANKNHLNFV